jgi:nitric oxide reductase NorE protein
MPRDEMNGRSDPGQSAEVASCPGTPHPGTEGLWIFIFIDMIIFLLMFIVYISERIRLSSVFAASQHQLSAYFGLANALILLTSSWAMVKAIEAVRHGLASLSHKWLSLCLATGLFFCINKLIEYGIKIEHGITPATNSFFTFYYVITGLHFTHVIGGMVFILHCRNRALAETGTGHYLKKLENTGLFWHFVDVLWLFIFPMLYLVGLR